MPVVGMRRSWMCALTFVLVLVLAGSQSVEHSHSSSVDAAQCAVCHWGQAEPEARVTGLDSVSPPAYVFFAGEADLPVHAPETSFPPPARAPPAFL